MEAWVVMELTLDVTLAAANFQWIHSPSRPSWSGVGCQPALSLYSSNEQDELLQ